MRSTPSWAPSFTFCTMGRVALSFEATTTNQIGMRHYLVVYGQARITEGGAPELLHELAQTYVGPGTDFPAVPEPAAGLHHSGQADAGQWRGPVGRLTTNGSV